MEEAVDQFTSTELADEVDQENIHSTISALLEGSLGDKEASETSPVAECGQTVVSDSKCEEKSSATSETNQEEGINAVSLRSEDRLQEVPATDPEIAKVTVGLNSEIECKQATGEPSRQMKSVDAPPIEDAGDSPTDSGQFSDDNSKNTDAQIPNAKCDNSVHLRSVEEFKDPSEVRSGDNLITTATQSCTVTSSEFIGPVLEEKSSKSNDIMGGDVQECSSVDPPQKLTDSGVNQDASNEHCHSVEERGWAGTDAKVSEAPKQLSDDQNFAPKRQKTNPSDKHTAELTDDGSHSPAGNVQKIAKKVTAEKKEDTTEPSIEDWNNIEAQENLKKDNTAPLKKHLRAPSKSVKYTEVNSSPEKADEDDDRVTTVPQVKKKLGRPLGSSKIRSSRVKPVEQEPVPLNSEAFVKNGNCVIIKEDSGKIKAIRLPKQTVNDDAEISLFVPEGWVFFVSKRDSGVHESHYDLYYVTPPPRVKLRSRIELVKYMAANGLNYDPTKFFIRKSIEPLVKKGILIKYREKYFVQPSVDEAVLQEVIKPLLRESKLKAKQLQSMKTKPNQFVRKALKRSVNSRAPIAQKIRKVSVAKSQPEEVSHQSAKKDSNDLLERGVGLAGEESNHPRKPLRGRPPKKLISSPSKTPDTDTTSDANVTSPRKSTRGRTRRSGVEEPETLPPPQPSAPIEERGRLRVRPPKKSPYFPPKSNDIEKPKNVLALRREKNDPPPRSPYNLIQEDLFHDPWQLLIATIFLNSTSGRVAIPLTLEFLKRWPTPELARQAKVDDILDVIEPLGFGRTRAAIILRFSHEYLTKEWKLPSELYGIGEYGNDSYKIFCLKNAWKSVQSDDPMLMMYLNWRRATEHLRKRFLNASSSRTIDPDDLYPTIASSAQPVNGAEASQKSIQSCPPPRKKRRARTSTK